MVIDEIHWVLFCCISPIFKFVCCVKRVILWNSCYYVRDTLINLKFLTWLHCRILKHQCLCHVSYVTARSNIDIDTWFNFCKFYHDISIFKSIQRILYFVVTNIITRYFKNWILVSKSIMYKGSLLVFNCYCVIFIRILNTTSCSVN
jgi:hypothetical protein